MSRIKFARGIAGAAIAAVAVLVGTAVSSVAQEDRLLGMVEPVKALKPYRIGYASADMNSDFFLRTRLWLRRRSEEGRGRDHTHCLRRRLRQGG